MKRIIFLAVATLLILSGCQPEMIFNGAQDIGKVSHPGHMSYNRADKTYTLTGAGVNMWEQADAFFMTWKKVSGNFSMQADIAFEGEGVNPHRKIGIIIREKLTPGSIYADVAVHGDGLTSLQYRDTENDLTKEEVSVVTTPTRIYMEREGNTIRIRTGHGALPKQADAAITINLPEECYVGFFLCSHEEDVSETGHFSNVIFKKR